MTDSRLTVYNQRHHDCKTLGELHGLADAMRGELLHEVERLETDLAERDGRRCATCRWSVEWYDDCAFEPTCGSLDFACNRWTARAEEGSET